MIKNEPPTFALFVNNPKYAANNYMPYLVNFMRKKFAFAGLPVKLELREKERRAFVPPPPKNKRPKRIRPGAPKSSPSTSEDTKAPRAKSKSARPATRKSSPSTSANTKAPRAKSKSARPATRKSGSFSSPKARVPSAKSRSVRRGPKKKPAKSGR